jgi:hypothetical protein
MVPSEGYIRIRMPNQTQHVHTVIGDPAPSSVHGTALDARASEVRSGITGLLPPSSLFPYESSQASRSA